MSYEKFPLRNLLKGRLLKIAELQDRLIIEISSKFDIVLHGGTAIWRIYEGKRFSFDIDFYYPDPSEILKYLEMSATFKPVRSKLTGSNVLYARFHEGDVPVEINVSPPFGKVSATDGEFYLVGGDSIVLKTLSQAELVREKVAAFRDRKKARDLYDIFYLLDEPTAADTKKELKGLLPLLKAPPDDFRGLKELIILGKVPGFDAIVMKVKKHAKD